MLEPSQLALLAAAGFASGWINVIAGGGSLLTVPVMVFMGLPGPVANGTNRIAIIAQNITAVGAFDDLAAHAPGARRIDLDGATLLPGFNDAHIHIWKLGLLLTVQVDVRTSVAPDIPTIARLFRERGDVGHANHAQHGGHVLRRVRNEGHQADSVRAR